MRIPIRILCNGKTVETKGLIDSGTGGTFMDQKFAQKHWFLTKKLEQPLIVFNVDSTLNKKGTITHSAELNITFSTRTRKTQFLISGLGKQHLIFGFPWLEKENPTIEWKLGTLEWKRTLLKIKFCGKPATLPEVINQTLSKEPDENSPDNNNKPSTMIFSISVNFPSKPNLYIQAKATATTSLTQQEKKTVIPLEDVIPKAYYSYLHLFNKKSSERFPKSRPWDHKNEMKEDFQPKVFKKYNLSPIKQQELDKFINENLAKGYIVPSQSPMASPIFFVSKKDRSFQPCQDYHYMNKKHQ